MWVNISTEIDFSNILIQIDSIGVSFRIFDLGIYEIFVLFLCIFLRIYYAFSLQKYMLLDHKNKNNTNIKNLKKTITNYRFDYLFYLINS